MSREDEAFLKRLLATFSVEANEHLGAMSRWLLALERAGSVGAMPAAVEALFREAHSLKGAARSVDLHEVERLCHAFESVFSRLKEADLTLGPPEFDLLLRALDTLQRYLACAPQTRSELALEPSIAEVGALSSRAIASGSRLAVDDAPAHAMDRRTQGAAARSDHGPDAIGLPFDVAAPDTVRVASAKIDALMTQAEELLGFKAHIAHVVGELRAARQSIGQWDRARTASLRALRAPQAALETVWRERRDADAQFAKSLDDRLYQLTRTTERAQRALAAMSDGLLDDIKQVLMLPTATLFEWMPKLVRDLARDSGKRIDLRLSGEGLEIDRRVLDRLKAPLMHLLRNAVDHGIETPAERQLAGKSESGTISVDALAQSNNTVLLTISDDGRGAEPEQLKQRAATLGLAQADVLSHMDDAKALSLVFESGLSTSAALTDVSGRGLGLAIVREHIEQLGGQVRVERKTSGGLRFCLTLPTRLANFHGLLLKLSEQYFVMPSIQVDRVLRIKPTDIKTVESRPTLLLNGQIVPLVALAGLMGLNSSGLKSFESISSGPASPPASSGHDATPDDTSSTVVVVNGSGRRVAFVVDTMLGGLEVLVRRLGPQLRRVRYLSGATVLGNGQVVPILNPADLLKAAYLAPPAQPTSDAAPETDPDESAPSSRSKAILVVEDSITSRALLKNILETAGYRVDCAVDGLDGLTILRNETYDLVVSDVEMPRMDGFALTRRIRDDARLAEIPVILVTALDTREHKERGIEVGANAYIVKSSFDQSTLLDAIRRLI